MKFLEAQQQDGKSEKKSIIPETENKMKAGTRLDQKNPESLISSPRRTSTTGASATSTTRTKSTDGAARLAKDLNVDLESVTGTGSGGQITESDVRKAHASTTENK